MLLNNNAFERVMAATGFQNAQYQGAESGLVKFKVWDGSEFEPARARYVWMTEEFTVDRSAAVTVITEDGLLTHPVACQES